MLGHVTAYMFSCVAHGPIVALASDTPVCTKTGTQESCLRDCCAMTQVARQSRGGNADDHERVQKLSGREGAIGSPAGRKSR